MKTVKALFLIVTIIFWFDGVAGQTKDVDSKLSALLNSKDDGSIIISKSKSFWEDVFRNDQLTNADKLINEKYKEAKYNLNIAYLFVGLALHLNQDMVDYLNFLQYINFDLEPDKMDSPAEIANLISSIIKDEKRVKFIDAILTLHLSKTFGNNEHGGKEDEYGEDDFASLANEIKSSVVRILVYNENDDLLYRRSGFFVKDGEIVTTIDKPKIVNADEYVLILSFAKMEIQLFNGDIYPVDSIKAYDDHLLALSVNFPEEVVEPLTITEALPAPQERVMVIAPYSESKVWYEVGVVSEILEIPISEAIIQTTIPFFEDFIGGPLVNTHGEVIGVVKGSRRVAGQELAYANPGDWVLTIGKRKIYRTFYDHTLHFDEPMEEPIKPLPEYQLICDGISYFEKKLYQKAIEAFKEALSIYPDLAHAYYQLSLVYARLGRDEEAQMALKEAKRIQPNVESINLYCK